MQVIFLVVGLAIGLVLGWLWANARLSRQFHEEREQRVAAETRLGEVERQRDQERSLVEQARAQLGDTFRALSSEALRENAQTIVERAKEALEPLGEALRRYEDHLREIEGARQQDKGRLDERLESLLALEQQLQRETGNLVHALRRPEVRGSWGEMALHRVVEVAGMTEYVDYVEQPTMEGDSGASRPDMIVKLPGGRHVVVDAKAPLAAYLSAVECEDEEARQEHLRQHSRQMRERMKELARKSYWDQFEHLGGSPEFVVMFVPGESFLHAACAFDHTLIEDGLAQRVLLASPVSLMGVLCAVAQGWREHRLAEGAQEMGELGRALHDRIRTFVGHMENVGKSLDKASTAFNQAVASLESRVLPAARRLRELGAAAGEEIADLEPIDTRPRELALPETTEEQS